MPSHRPLELHKTVSNTYFHIQNERSLNHGIKHSTLEARGRVFPTVAIQKCALDVFRDGNMEERQRMGVVALVGHRHLLGLVDLTDRDVAVAMRVQVIHAQRRGIRQGEGLVGTAKIQRAPLTVRQTATGSAFRILQIPDLHFSSNANTRCLDKPECRESYMSEMIAKMCDEL
ncbi:Aste57867_16643 [Aphanomyces stellatus]|uniref:Aste57867_16643 protein n=1 Tax=Aphanomyces stellatus TaxID=120398 RepID=A0A485L6S2_9STRA|nr:hypothetical protein As57867_016586 [Aphanomyces stellatus]VFT93414.1 Aste57867_16643 [Aphanomyces stellatus]